MNVGINSAISYIAKSTDNKIPFNVMCVKVNPSFMVSQNIALVIHCVFSSKQFWVCFIDSMSVFQ